MKMKLVSVAFFFATLVLSLLLRRSAYLLPSLPFIFGVAFAAYGVAKSMRSAHLNPLNDLPNAFRVFLASSGGYLVTLAGAFVFPSIGILLLIGALYLNDEFQRRALRALRTGTKGGSIAFLGIDGSGKSSHSSVTGDWLRQRGYQCDVMPFHRYLFVEQLASISSALRKRSSGRSANGEGTAAPAAAAAAVAAGATGAGRHSPSAAAISSSSSFPSSPYFLDSRRRKNPLRPVLSLVDNLILQLSSSIGCRVEGKVIIYDRFIWSTYIKYKALGYPVRLLSALYLLPEPTYALVLDVPVDKSLRVIDERIAHIHYPARVLQAESDEYLGIARRKGYPIIDATGSFEEVQEKIQSRLSGLFPPVGSQRGRVSAV